MDNQNPVLFIALRCSACVGTALAAFRTPPNPHFKPRVETNGEPQPLPHPPPPNPAPSWVNGRLAISCSGVHGAVTAVAASRGGTRGRGCGLVGAGQQGLVVHQPAGLPQFSPRRGLARPPPSRLCVYLCVKFVEGDDFDFLVQHLAFCQMVTVLNEHR